MQKYDLVISLGAGCPTADALKRLKITEKSYPFDWSDCDGDASEKLLKKCNLIKNHFDGAFNYEDFVEYWTMEKKSRSVKNKKTGLHYWHDFPWERTVKDSWSEFFERYQRRVNRLYADIEHAVNILFVYEDISQQLSISAIKSAIKILKECIPNKNITLLVVLPLLSDGSKKIQELKLGIKNVIVLSCPMIEKKGMEYNETVFNIKKCLGYCFCNDYYSFEFDKDIICSGLSNIEPFGRWSDGEVTFFRLQTNSKQKKVSIKMNVVPFINDLRKTQHVKIICNGNEISEAVFDNSNQQTINLIVPNDNDGNLDFVFEFDNPVSPKELGLSNDERKLSLGFIDAVISEK